MVVSGGSARAVAGRTGGGGGRLILWFGLLWSEARSVALELEPDVRGAFGYSPSARFGFDDLQATAAEGVKPCVSDVVFKAGAVVDDVYAHLSAIGFGFHRDLSLPVKHGVVYELAREEPDGVELLRCEFRTEPFSQQLTCQACRSPISGKLDF
jgi:hypothetical protein